MTMTREIDHYRAIKLVQDWQYLRPLGDPERAVDKLEGMDDFDVRGLIEAGDAMAEALSDG